jgi:hypothetical protein
MKLKIIFLVFVLACCQALSGWVKRVFPCSLNLITSSLEHCTSSKASICLSIDSISFSKTFNTEGLDASLI